MEKWNLDLGKISDKGSKRSEGRKALMKATFSLPASSFLTDFSVKTDLLSCLKSVCTSSGLGNEWNARLLNVACGCIWNQDFSHFDSAWDTHTTEMAHNALAEPKKMHWGRESRKCTRRIPEGTLVSGIWYHIPVPAFQVLFSLSENESPPIPLPDY